MATIDRKKIVLAVATVVAVAVVALWLTGPLRTMLNKNNNYTTRHIDINKLPVEVIDLGKVEDLDWVPISWNTRYIIPLRTATGFQGPLLMLPPILRPGKRMYIVYKPRGVGFIGIATVCGDVLFGCPRVFGCSDVTNYTLYINVTAIAQAVSRKNCTEIVYVDVNNTYVEKLLISTPLNGTDRGNIIQIGPLRVGIFVHRPFRQRVGITCISTRRGNVTVIPVVLS